VKTKYVRTIDVTVVIPTHNRREQILRALASLTVQSMAASRYEVVVGIDGSTDGTADALAALSLPYAFRWAYQTRQGPGAARNLGAEHAVGDVLVFLDDDHTASVQLLARHWSHHCGDEMVIVQGYYPVSPHALHDGSALLFDRKYRAAMERLRRGGCADLWGGNYSIRRDSFMSVGGYSSMSFDQGWGIGKASQLAWPAAAARSSCPVPSPLSMYLSRVCSPVGVGRPWDCSTGATISGPRCRDPARFRYRGCIAVGATTWLGLYSSPDAFVGTGLGLAPPNVRPARARLGTDRCSSGGSAVLQGAR
jgi:hypothetical protein